MIRPEIGACYNGSARAAYSLECSVPFRTGLDLRQ